MYAKCRINSAKNIQKKYLNKFIINVNKRCHNDFTFLILFGSCQKKFNILNVANAKTIIV